MTLRFCFFSMRLRFSSLALFSALIQLDLGALVKSRSMAVSDDEKGGLASFSDSQTGSLIAAAKAAATAAALIVTLRVGSET
jgi:hypothetical protein